jgi:CRISPR-associated protein (TIGR03984 family)
MTLRGAHLSSLPASEVRALLDWLEASASPGKSLEAMGTGPHWVLAHCDDGVTWGLVDEGRVRWAEGAWAGPRPTRANVQQVRVFGPEAEFLVWRVEGEGTFQARRLADGEPSKDWCRPKEERFLIAATRMADDVATGHADFSAVDERDGRRQVLPPVCDPLDDRPRGLRGLTADDFEKGAYGVGLELHHYLDEDDGTGCVRVAASRLVRLVRLAPEEQRAPGEPEGRS